MGSEDEKRVEGARLARAGRLEAFVLSPALGAEIRGLDLREPIAWISDVEPGFHPEGELQWHCDYAFTPHPMHGLSLHAIELAPGAPPREPEYHSPLAPARRVAARQSGEGCDTVAS